MTHSVQLCRPMPSLFISHGSPRQRFRSPITTGRRSGSRILPTTCRGRAPSWSPTPISRCGRGLLSADPAPETINDFGGFAPELYGLHYSAPGEPQLARRIAADFQAARLQVPVQLGQPRLRSRRLGAAETDLIPDADIPDGVGLQWTRARPEHHFRLARRWRGSAPKGCWSSARARSPTIWGEAFQGAEIRAARAGRPCMGSRVHRLDGRTNSRPMMSRR